MVYANKASKKRVALLLILGLGGFVSLLVGLSWDTVLHAHATDLARTENAFNLMNPDHLSLANTIVVGVIGLGHFLLVFGIATTLTGLIGVVYIYLRSTGNPGLTAPGSCRALVTGALLVLLATGAVAWATSGISYEDNLAADPPAPSTSSAGHKEEEEDCTASPTPDQREAADKLVADTKAGVAKYVDLSVARTDGYRPASPTWQPITHYLNPAYERDGATLDPGRPEALVYANTSKGPLLLGAMYLMPEPGVPGPRIGGCLTGWHAHSLLGWETPQMMHVWTVNMPGGPFGEPKPRQFVSSLEG